MQGRIQNPENGEQDQGSGQKREEDQLALACGDEVQWMGHTLYRFL